MTFHPSHFVKKLKIKSVRSQRWFLIKNILIQVTLVSHNFITQFLLFFHCLIRYVFSRDKNFVENQVSNYPHVANREEKWHRNKTVMTAVRLNQTQTFLILFKFQKWYIEYENSIFFHFTNFVWYFAILRFLCSLLHRILTKHLQSECSNLLRRSKLRVKFLH